MAEPRDGGPAFPQPATAEGHATNTPPGMSLRDYFAGQALAGMVANSLTDEQVRATKSDPCAVVASWAYEYADAMLAARADRATDEEIK